MEKTGCLMNRTCSLCANNLLQVEVMNIRMAVGIISSCLLMTTGGYSLIQNGASFASILFAFGGLAGLLGCIVQWQKGKA